MNILNTLFPKMDFDYQLRLSPDQVYSLLGTQVQEGNMLNWSRNRIFQGKISIHQFDIFRVPEHRYDVGCKILGRIVANHAGSHVSFHLEMPMIHRYKLWIIALMLIFLYNVIYNRLPNIWWAALVLSIIGLFYTSTQMKKDMHKTRQFFDAFFLPYTSN
jgi:hypothetical protein